MKSYFNLALISFMLCSPIFGQDSPSSKKNELSLDLLTFTRKNTVPGIIYKRKYDKGAFRIKLNSTFDFNEVSNTTPSSDPEISIINITDEVSSFNAQFFIGYEWNKHIQSKWTILYGVDFVLDLSNETNTRKEVYKRNSGTVGRIVTNENEVSGTKYGLSPFIGCNYYFNESISVGVESYVLVLFGGQDVSTTLTDQSSTATTRVIDSNAPSTTQLDLTPKTVITIGYRF